MSRRLEHVRASGIPFGFIFTLTQHNIHELEWVAAFALEQGASLLQVHPLEEVGRARTLLSGSRPDATEGMYAFMEVLRLQASVGDRMRIQLDLADRNVLRDEPGRGLVAPADIEGTRPFANILSPLIVETDGTVVPLQHGFPRHFALGNLGASSLGDLADGWTQDTYPTFRALCKRALDLASSSTDLPFFNWYELVAELARQTAIPPKHMKTAG
jgi:MoaA/NifB/PqqE/SkfB family radical SAM enzyme